MIGFNLHKWWLSDSNMSICKIPSDIQLLVIGQLNADQILVFVSSCKQLHQLINENSLWQQKLTTDFPKVVILNQSENCFLLYKWRFQLSNKINCLYQLIDQNEYAIDQKLKRLITKVIIQTGQKILEDFLPLEKQLEVSWYNVPDELLITLKKNIIEAFSSKQDQTKPQDAINQIIDGIEQGEPMGNPF